MSDFPPPEPHEPIQEIWDGVFWVRGSVRMGPGLRIPRNMAVVRDGDDLTLVSSVRLSKEGEAELEKLGTVKHVVKIGIHGMDDAYCVQRFGATYWAPEGTFAEGGPKHETLREGGDLPISDATLFSFHDTKKPEAAILLSREGGILLTCDSVQNWVGLDGCSLVARGVMRAMGFLHPMNIGPPWRKLMTKEGGSLLGDFDRLTALPFDHALGGHGDPAVGGARAGLQATMARVFA